MCVHDSALCLIRYLQATAPSSSGSELQSTPENLMFMHTGPHSAGLHMPYSPFPSGDGSWTSSFDPNLMTAGFGFPAHNMMTAQPLQNQFYFPGADMGIWGQDPLSNPLLMSSYLLSPVAMDQQQLAGAAVTLDGTGVTSAVDPVTGLAQGFSGIAVNGSMQGMIPMGQTLLPGIPGTPGGVENTSQNSTSSSNHGQSSAPQPEKPKSWAAIASQPAKPRPPPPKPQPQPETQVVDTTKKSQTAGNRSGGLGPQNRQQAGSQGGGSVVTIRGGGVRRTQHPQQGSTGKGKPSQSDVAGKLQADNKYNPTELAVNLTNARFFVIKSYAEDDIHRSIKYSIWTSTEHGNRRLDQAFREQKGKGSVYLFYSVNGSGHFCGMAQMTSEVDFNTTTGVWAQDKWKGRFDVKWVYVKDVPNSQLRHIRLENNENKPVTNSRDTQEVPPEKGKQIVRIVHNYHYTTSIFDDFEHYEKKQEEDTKKVIIVLCLWHVLGFYQLLKSV